MVYFFLDAFSCASGCWHKKHIKFRNQNIFAYYLKYVLGLCQLVATQCLSLQTIEMKYNSREFLSIYFLKFVLRYQGGMLSQ